MEFDGVEDLFDSTDDDSFIDSDSDADSIVDYSSMAAKYDMSNSGLKYSGGPADDLDTFIAKFKNHCKL